MWVEPIRKFLIERVSGVAFYRYVLNLNVDEVLEEDYPTEDSFFPLVDESLRPYSKISFYEVWRYFRRGIIYPRAPENIYRQPILEALLKKSSALKEADTFILHKSRKPILVFGDNKFFSKERYVMYAPAACVSVWEPPVDIPMVSTGHVQFNYDESFVLRMNIEDNPHCQTCNFLSESCLAFPDTGISGYAVRRLCANSFWFFCFMTGMCPYYVNKDGYDVPDIYRRRQLGKSGGECFTPISKKFSDVVTELLSSLSRVQYTTYGDYPKWERNRFIPVERKCEAQRAPRGFDPDNDKYRQTSLLRGSRCRKDVYRDSGSSPFDEL